MNDCNNGEEKIPEKKSEWRRIGEDRLVTVSGAFRDPAGRIWLETEQNWKLIPLDGFRADHDPLIRIEEEDGEDGDDE